MFAAMSPGIGWALLAAAAVAIAALFVRLQQRRKRQRGAGAVGGDARVPLVALVNPKSGGGLGNKLIHAFSLVAGGPSVFPLTDEGLANAMHKLIALRRQGLEPRIICAGGDGTVTAVVRVMLEHRLGDIPVAVLPLGTGNDCAGSLGMSLPSLAKKPLTQWLTRVRSATTTPTDVFEIVFDTYEDVSRAAVAKSPAQRLACCRTRAACAGTAHHHHRRHHGCAG